MAYDYVGDLSVAVRFEGGLDEDLAPPADICKAGLAMQFIELASKLAAPTDKEDRTLPSHQVGGWPESLQFFQLAPGQSLLCQIDSDDALGWCWGDVGRMFFLADSEALARGDFSGVTLEIESS